MKALHLRPYDLGGLEWGVMAENPDWNRSAGFPVSQAQTFVAAAAHRERLVLVALGMAVALVAHCLLAVPLGRHREAGAVVQEIDDRCRVSVAAEVDLGEVLCWDSFFAEVEALDDKASVAHHP